MFTKVHFSKQNKEISGGSRLACSNVAKLNLSIWVTVPAHHIDCLQGIINSFFIKKKPKSVFTKLHQSFYLNNCSQLIIMQFLIAETIKSVANNFGN